jgi:hypothetical protein
MTANAWDDEIDGGSLTHDELITWDGRPVVIRTALVSETVDYRRVEFGDGSRLYVGIDGPEDSEATATLTRMLAAAYNDDESA